MSDGMQVADVLARIPGWCGARVELLHGGLSNRTYLVSKDDARAVLKIDDEPRAAPLNSRQSEARIQSSAAAAGLAGSVLYFDDSCLLTEYVEGRAWRAEDLRDEARLQQLGQRLRQLHSLPLSGRTFDASDAARLYLRTIKSDDTEQLERCVHIIDSMPAPMNLSLCHNDLVVGNLIDAGQIMFIDWEYACDNDPFFDLATVAAHHDLSEAQLDVVLRSYFDGDWQRWSSQLQRQIEHYEALLWLWNEARATSCCGAP